MSGDVIFVLQGEEISMPRRTIESGSAYLNHILEGSPSDPEVRILLPDWVSRRPLMLYLEYLTSHSVPKVDLHTAQRLLWLADFLYDEVLQNALLYDLIQPNLTSETVVSFLMDAYMKLEKNKESIHWKTLFKFCIGFVGGHAEAVFRDHQEALNKFPNDLLEDIIRVAAETMRLHADSDYTYVAHSLMGLRGCESPLQLLDIEEERCTSSPKFSQAVFSWTLTGVSLDNYIQESPSFDFAGLTWHLKVWSFAHEPKLAIALAAAGHHLTRLPKYSLFSLTCTVKASLDDHPNPQLVTITVDGKSQIVLRYLVGLNEAQLRRITITLFAEPAVLHSMVLSYICSCPSECLSGKELSGISEKMLILLLTHKRLGVESEDEVLEIIGRWCQEVYGKEMNDEVEICKILETVRWDYVTLKSLFQTIRNFPALKNSKCFREILQRVVEQRGSQNRYSVYELTSIDPRKSYKQTASKESFQSQRDFMHYLSTLVLDLEFNPKSLAESANVVEDLKSAIKARELEIRSLEDSLQALEGLARRPQSISSSPLSAGIDLHEAEQRVTIPVPRGKASKGPVSEARPPIFKMKGDDLPDETRPRDFPSP